MKDTRKILALGAVLGVACFSASFGYVYGALNYPQQERYQRYERAQNEPEEISWAAPLAERTKYREPCKAPKGREDSDLCAQWKAARAAESSSFWAKLSFYLGLFGTLGLFLTLFYTREAVRVAQSATEDADSALAIAKQNADAAAAHVKIANTAARHQLRSYAYVKSCALNESGDFNVDGDVITVEFVNSGQTPAKICQIDIRIDWQDEIGTLILHKQTANVSFEVNNGTPVATNFSLKEIPKDRRDNIGRIMCYGRFSYTDVFGDKHPERFVFSNQGGLAYDELPVPLRLNATVFTPVREATDEE